MNSILLVLFLFTVFSSAEKEIEPNKKYPFYMYGVGYGGGLMAAGCPPVGGYMLEGYCPNGFGCSSHAVCWYGACCALASISGVAVVSPVLVQNVGQPVLVTQQRCPLTNQIGPCVNGICGAVNGIQLPCINGVCCVVQNGK